MNEALDRDQLRVKIGIVVWSAYIKYQKRAVTTIKRVKYLTISQVPGPKYCLKNFIEADSWWGLVQAVSYSP